MAKEEEDKKATEAAEEKSKDSKSSEGGKGGLVGLAIKALIVLVLAGGVGFGLGKFINASGEAQASEEASEQEVEQEKPSTDEATSKNPVYKYVDFEKITSNLNDPRMTKYIAVTIKLAINTDDKQKQKEVESLIESEKARLISWLTTYLSGCTLNNVRGTKNLNRIRREICDKFNELLWPDQKPFIREVLFEEFVIS